MFRLLTREELNRSWVPLETNFSTKEQFEETLRTTHPYEQDITVINEALPTAPQKPMMERQMTLSISEKISKVSICEECQL